MAASITDLLDRVSSSATGRPVVAALAAPGHSIGGTTININDATNWDTGSAKHISIYATQTIGGVVVKDPTTQTDWKCTIAGTVISNMTITGGVDRDYSAGVIVELTPTARYARDLYDWAIAQHNQDGTHGVVTATSVTASGNVQGSMVISTGDIQHRSVSLETIRSNYIYDFVASGLVWSGDAYGSTRLASMTSGAVYIGGKRVAVSAVTSRTFTASRDTYVDVDNTGAITYTEVTNNNTSPALSANNIRVAIIITGASNIANSGSVNQGQETMVLPIVSSVAYSVTDSLGNLICNRDPAMKLIGYRQTLTTTTGITTSVVDLTGLTAVPFIVPTNRKIKVTAFFAFSSTSAGDVGQAYVKESSTTILDGYTVLRNANNQEHLTRDMVVTASSGSHTYKSSMNRAVGAGTFTAETSSIHPAFVRIELY